MGHTQDPRPAPCWGTSSWSLQTCLLLGNILLVSEHRHLHLQEGLQDSVEPG